MYGRLAIGLTGSATCFVYYLLLYEARLVGYTDRLPAAAAGWIPNVVFGGIALVLLKTGRERTPPTRASASGG
jgi:lipopolysaccharide export LptBFGC system permease protein LptF